MNNFHADSTGSLSDNVVVELWALSGGPALHGYERSVLVVMARCDLPTYAQLIAIDLDDADAVRGAVAAVAEWRQAVADGARSFAFGLRRRQLALAS